MTSGSLHPEIIRAQCRPRRRGCSFGLTPRAIWLLAAGLLLALPGFFHASWSLGMVEWDALILAAAIFDWLRLPQPERIVIARSWNNAPALDSETEIELAIEQHGGGILQCRILDDLPDALAATPPEHNLHAYPNARAHLRYRFQPRERGDVQTGAVYLRYSSPLGLVERWAMAPLEQTVRVYPTLRRGEDLSLIHI